jgi:hypothetical protein
VPTSPRSLITQPVAGGHRRVPSVVFGLRHIRMRVGLVL